MEIRRSYFDMLSQKYIMGLIVIQGIYDVMERFTLLENIVDLG